MGRRRFSTPPAEYIAEELSVNARDFPIGTCVRYMPRNGVYGRILGDPYFDHYLMETMFQVEILSDPYIDPPRSPRGRIIRRIADYNLHKGDYCEDAERD